MGSDRAELEPAAFCLLIMLLYHLSHHHPCCRLMVGVKPSLLRSVDRETLAKMARRMNATSEMCVEHEEKLRLFCLTDQKLICLVCREGEEHQGHTFRPIKEAAQAYMEEVRQVCEFVSKDNSDLEFMLKLQTAEGAKTKERSSALLDQISDQFKPMHQFLREKEAELQRMARDEEKLATECIERSAAAIQRQLLEGRQQQDNLKRALEIQQSDQLLQWWVESGRSLMEELKSDSTAHTQNAQAAGYRSKVRGLSVSQPCVDLGPYESHLAFFVWKQMLQVVTPAAERVTVRDPGDERVRVSLGGSSVRQTDRRDAVLRDYNPVLVAQEAFPSGQHYWEVEVGEKPDWGLGVAVTDPQSPHTSQGIMLFLSHQRGGYCIREFGNLTPLQVRGKPRRVGVFLNCDRRKVCFYDATSMALLYSSIRPFERVLYACLCPGLYLDGRNSAPLNICW
ncbi:nuclear factor 7, brain-like [Engraulis encrasicolus]|uniref:nuclear factor 7, brain-like n=1 Tax=Engraulis encrasicolus TaxID=184585 RepID=UPI002FCF47C3